MDYKSLLSDTIRMQGYKGLSIEETQAIKSFLGYLDPDTLDNILFDIRNSELGRYRFSPVIPEYRHLVEEALQEWDEEADNES